jgi:hypothetical protein
VLAANDGVDALAVAKNHGAPMDLLVTDVVMPNLANWRSNSLDCVRTKNCCSFWLCGKTVLDRKVGDPKTNFLQKP